MAYHAVCPNVRESLEGNMGSKGRSITTVHKQNEEVIKTAAIMNQAPIIMMCYYYVIMSFMPCVMFLGIYSVQNLGVCPMCVALMSTIMQCYLQ